jgi:hypothetical protein
VTDFNQPCSDGFSVTDGIVKSVTLNLIDSRIPNDSLYPGASLYPGHIIGVADVDTKAFTKNEVEAFTATDTPVKRIVKNLEEGGLYPSATLYPTGTLYPNAGVLVEDEIVKTPCKNASDSSTVSDVSSFGTGKGLSDNIEFLEEFINAVVKNVDESTTILESSVYNINKNFDENTTVSDVFTVLFTSYLTESVGISEDIVKSIVKHLLESGEFPLDTLYPTTDLYPDGGIDTTDTFSFGLTTNLSDGFSIIDSIARSIIKDIPDDINISDNILFSTVVYLEENQSILDEISKHGYKSLTDSTALIDDIVKNITPILSDSIGIDDEMTYVLRTLVRATLEAVDDGGATLSAIKNRLSSLSLA